MSQAAQSGISAPGVIEPEALYTLDELKARSRLGSYALRTLRREHGLRVLRFGGRGFILGAHFIAALEAAAGAEGAE